MTEEQRGTICRFIKALTGCIENDCPRRVRIIAEAYIKEFEEELAKEETK